MFGRRPRQSQTPDAPPAKRAPRRSGTVLVYVTFALPTFVAFSALAVDFGRVQLVKTQLQTVTDAAGRFAAAGMVSSSTKGTTAYAQALAVCNDSIVDGRTPTCSTSDVAVGIWNNQSRTFTVSTNAASINAVRVTLAYTVGGTGSTPLLISAIGGRPLTVRATTVVTGINNSTTITIPSSGNMWLAGMPDNTVTTNLQGNATRYDNNGTSGNAKQRPLEAKLADLGVQPGDTLSFEGLSGTASNDGGNSGYTGPDGKTWYNVAVGAAPAGSKPNNSVNGIANARAPLSGVMAVFMDDSSPTSTGAPATLDFNTSAQRSYKTLAPLKKQPFFVGDGKTEDTGEVQQITIPAGATRVFFGMMDAWQWNDNVGNFKMKVYRQTIITTVK